MATKTPYEKIASILRVDKDIIKNVEERLSAVTGKTGVLENLVSENDNLCADRLSKLGLVGPTAKQAYDALLEKARQDDARLFSALGNPDVSNPEDWSKILNLGKEIFQSPKGMFLKKEKAIEFLKNYPPQKVLDLLDYKSVDELVEKENLFEIFASLRFVEGGDWLNAYFFKQYETLTPDDFEEREVVAIALSKKWEALARDFVAHKLHNISHLKELGFLYVIPISLDIPGETLRNVSLIFHYFNEIPFYADLFARFSKNPETFAQKVISLLRGDVLDERLPQTERMNWMIVQRYLAKDDENDWRLYEPHLNPEAIHWTKAERKLTQAGIKLGSDFSFWDNLSWVGEFYKTDAGTDALVSFDLVDTAMSLVAEKMKVRQLYHHQEALWNKIFSSYFGEENMEEIIKENLIKGRFEI